MANKDIGKLSALGNQKRTEKVGAARRSSIASTAAKARWLKYNKQKCARCGAFRSAHKPPAINHKFVEEL